MLGLSYTHLTLTVQVVCCPAAALLDWAQCVTDVSLSIDLQLLVRARTCVGIDTYTLV
jgi:hypothetical protein